MSLPDDTTEEELDELIKRQMQRPPKWWDSEVRKQRMHEDYDWIRVLFSRGHRVGELAEVFGYSKERVWQIVAAPAQNAKRRQRRAVMAK